MSLGSLGLQPYSWWSPLVSCLLTSFLIASFTQPFHSYSLSAALPAFWIPFSKRCSAWLPWTQGYSQWHPDPEATAQRQPRAPKPTPLWESMGHRRTLPASVLLPFVWEITHFCLPALPTFIRSNNQQPCGIWSLALFFSLFFFFFFSFCCGIPMAVLLVATLLDSTYIIAGAALVIPSRAERDLRGSQSMSPWRGASV